MLRIFPVGDQDLLLSSSLPQSTLLSWGFRSLCIFAPQTETEPICLRLQPMGVYSSESEAIFLHELVTHKTEWICPTRKQRHSPHTQIRVQSLFIGHIGLLGRRPSEAY
ncbi:hypothetical protein JAAARDRAFT_36035 [Jaapia argillacea MUCL 33604]|uniref:Uncharacterized protein n=1 Tax=Jaapia argillacea MUCL 33604 TaxID=933084 RepID=A0A067Q1R9_9AGAM|nr:hypothetical protein JAAARDRAFT_36035 [Jaapia argillacea MUCL 33604]